MLPSWEPQGVPWDIKENQDQLIINTQALKVIVKADGAIQGNERGSCWFIYRVNGQ